MSQQIEVRFQPGPYVAMVEAGTSLLAAARLAGAPLEAPCDGSGICGKCLVRVDAAELDALDLEPKRYSGDGPQSVLACDVRVRAPVTVTLPTRDSALAIVEEGAGTVRALAPHVVVARTRSDSTVYAGQKMIAVLPGQAANLGVAIDVGTTTLVVALVDLETGRELAVASALNPQATFGHDVLSRIRFAREASGLATLQKTLVESLNQLIARVCGEAGQQTREVHEAVLGGNTCMLHLAAGVDPTPLGRSPYPPRIRGGCHLQATNLGLDIAPHGLVYLPPVVSGFVGADITAGILATDLHRAVETTLLLDIGTNGEMVLSSGGKLWATSTAAGPAFEGVNIACGMRAARGAIDRVSRDPGGAWELHTIGDAPATGICGSGLVELVSGLVGSQSIGKTGRFQFASDPPVGCWSDGDGRRLLRLADNVVLTQNDVRQVQLAKAAIRAGIDSLLGLAGLGQEEVRRVLVAGSFGYHLRPASLAGSGLLPPGLAARVEAVGNTCKSGAVVLLTNAPARQELESVTATVHSIELANDPFFGQRFVANMAFGDA